jgi:Transposase and inactivated derivatives
LIIYFVTLCVKDRRPVLANTKVFEAIKVTIVQLRRWYVLTDVIMPDHAHWLVSPRIDRDISVSDFANGFKRVLRNKWIYVEDNPVRQGLVQRREDWPYYLDFINDEGSYQLPLQAERSRK